MIKKSFRFISRIFFSILLAPTLAFADPEPTRKYFGDPSSGRISFSGTFSEETIFSGDAMLPLYGNRDGFLYSNIMSGYATDDTFLVSPGAGYRQIFSNQLFGAYFFGDYERTNLSENFWVLSPGIEWMTSRWDAHINGYFPVNNSQQMGAPAFGDYSKVSFQSGTHNQFNGYATSYAMIGNGVDTELGFSFSDAQHLRSRLYVGSYYYQPPSEVSSFTGVTFGYEKALSKNLSVAFRNSYDSVKNYTVAVGVTFTLGGNSNTFSNDVHDRLLDPVQRHVGIISTGAGTYAQTGLKDTGYGLQYNNVYFISPTGSSTAGTYGNSMALNQNNLDSIYAQSPDGARIYIQGGSDAVYHVDSTTATGITSLGVHPGQDLYGRTADYTVSATNVERPQILSDAPNNYASFSTNGGENTFSSLKIGVTEASLSGEVSGIIINNPAGNSTTTIDNVDVSGADVGVTAENYSAGSLTLNVLDSTINNNVLRGMVIHNDGFIPTGVLELNITNSQFNNNGLTTGPSNANNTDGILVVNGTDMGGIVMNITNSQFNGNGIAQAGGTSAVASESAGISVVNWDANSTVSINITDSQFNGNGVAIDGTVAGIAAGIYAHSELGGIDLNITNSQFNGNGVAQDNGTVTGTAAGMIVSSVAGSTGSISLSATDSQFNGNGLVDGSGTVTGPTAGLYLNNASTNDGTLSVTDLSNSSFSNNSGYGIYGTAVMTETTDIDYSNASFSGDSQTNHTNQAEMDNNVTWVDN